MTLRISECGKISDYRLKLESNCFTFPQSEIRDPQSLQRPAEILKAIEPLLDHVDAGRITEAHRAIIAEGNAGNDRHIGLAQQSIGEVLRAESQLADVYQDVERTLGFHCGDIWDLRNSV